MDYGFWDWKYFDLIAYDFNVKALAGLKFEDFMNKNNYYFELLSLLESRSSWFDRKTELRRRTDPEAKAELKGPRRRSDLGATKTNLFVVTFPNIDAAGHRTLTNR